MSYDPRTLGAQCDRCPLGPDGCLRKRDWRPFKSEIHETRGQATADIAAVFGHPAEDDRKAGYIFAGKSGHEWNRQLRAVGLQRKNADLIPAIACQLPGQDGGATSRLNSLLNKLRRKEVKRLKNSEEKLTSAEMQRRALEKYPHPVNCCKPRLERELEPYSSVIALGKTAANILTGNSGSISSLEGEMIEVGNKKVVPTYSPIFVSNKQAMRPAAVATIAKALRWFKGALRWIDPEMLWQPEPHQLVEWLSVDAPFWVCDTETDGLHPYSKSYRPCKVRCLAITTPDLKENGGLAMAWDTPAKVARTVVINILGGDGVTTFYNRNQLREVKYILKKFLLDPNRKIVGHNFGYYDRMVFETWLNIEFPSFLEPNESPIFDTLFPTRFSNPAGKKGLKPAGRLHTDVHRWETNSKGEKNSSGKVTDEERGIYCGYDTTVNSRIVAPLTKMALEAGAAKPLPEWAKPVDWPSIRNWNLMNLDHYRQEMCLEMHKNGVYIDQKLRGKLEVKFTRIAGRLEDEIKERAKEFGMESFNPNSHPQMRELLYEKFRLDCPPTIKPKDFYTESGEPGTGAQILRGHIANREVSDRVRSMLITLIQLRRVKTKILGTQLKNAAMAPVGRIDPDGRGRGNWNAHTTAPGRLSCSGLALQTLSNRKDLGGILRIYCAAPGNVLIGADLSAAHLVNAANFWGVNKLIDCFNSGGDPHLEFIYATFGDKLKEMDGWGPLGFGLTVNHKPKRGSQAGNAREYGKNHRYSGMYNAVVETILEVLRASEMTKLLPNDLIQTTFPNLGLTARQVRLFDDNWHRSEPEWKIAWRRCMEQYHANGGHMKSYIFGRQSGDLEGGKPTEVVNFPSISTEQDVMAIAEARVRRSFPFQKWGPGTGMIIQLHDGIYVEVPEHLAEWGVKEIERCMTVEVPGCPVVYSCEAKVGRNLAEM